MQQAPDCFHQSCWANGALAREEPIQLWCRSSEKGPLKEGLVTYLHVFQKFGQLLRKCLMFDVKIWHICDCLASVEVVSFFCDRGDMILTKLSPALEFLMEHFSKC